jgi:hypothetical protein
MMGIEHLTAIALALAVAAAVIVATPSAAQHSQANPAWERAARACSGELMRFAWRDFEIDSYRACMARRGQSNEPFFQP